MCSCLHFVFYYISNFRKREFVLFIISFVAMSFSWGQTFPMQEGTVRTSVKEFRSGTNVYYQNIRQKFKLHMQSYTEYCWRVKRLFPVALNFSSFILPFSYLSSFISLYRSSFPYSYVSLFLSMFLVFYMWITSMSAAMALRVCIKHLTTNRWHNEIKVTYVTAYGLVHKTRARYAPELDIKSKIELYKNCGNFSKLN